MMKHFMKRMELVLCVAMLGSHTYAIYDITLNK